MTTAPDNSAIDYSFGPVMPAALRGVVDPKVKSAVDKVLDAWGTNVKGSGQRVIRDFTDVADGVPEDVSKASDQERLGYAMKVLEGFEKASPFFSKKAFGSWESAVLPFTQAYAPASKIYSEWQPDYLQAEEGGVPSQGPVDYKRWAQVAPQLGFKGQMFEAAYDSEGGAMQGGPTRALQQFVDQKRAEGYDFVSKRSNIHNYNNYTGFKLPSGEVVAQTRTGDDDDIKSFFKDFVLPVATTVVGIPGYGGEAISSLGNALLPAEAAKGIAGALGVSEAAVTAAVGKGIVNAGLSAITGGDLGDVAKAGVLPLAGTGVSSVVSGLVPESLGSLEKAAERAITSGIMGELSGKQDFGDAVVGSLTGSAIGSASETLGLPSSVVRGAVELGTSGKIDPMKALTAATDFAQQLEKDQQQAVIDQAYRDPSRALDVVQPSRDVVSEEDAFTDGEGDVFSGDFETERTIEDLAEELLNINPPVTLPTEPAEPDIFTPETQQPRDEFVEPYITTPSEATEAPPSDEPPVEVTATPFFEPEPEYFTPNIYDLATVEPEPVEPPPVEPPFFEETPLFPEFEEPLLTEPPPVEPPPPSLDDIFKYIDEDVATQRPVIDTGLPAKDEWEQILEEILPTLPPEGGVGSVDEGYDLTQESVFDPTYGGTLTLDTAASEGDYGQETFDLLEQLNGVPGAIVPGGADQGLESSTGNIVDYAGNVIAAPSPAPAPAPAPAPTPAPAPAPRPPAPTRSPMGDLQGLFALMAMMNQQKKQEQDRPNIADVQAGLRMSPYGLPYGG